MTNKYSPTSFSCTNFYSNRNWRATKGKCNFYFTPLLKHVTDRDSLNLIPFVWRWPGPKNEILFKLSWKKAQIGSARKKTFEWCRHTLENLFCARLHVLCFFLPPRDTFISLHCNYVWWQNYDPNRLLVKRYFYFFSSFAAHLTNVRTCERWAELRGKGKHAKRKRKRLSGQLRDLNKRFTAAFLQILIAEESQQNL